MARVIRFCPKSIRIEFKGRFGVEDVSIFNTRNRIFIMTENGGIEKESKYSASLREKNIKIDKLENTLSKTKEKLEKAKAKIDIYATETDKLIRDKIELQKNYDENIEEFEKHFSRFNLLDL